MNRLVLIGNGFDLAHGLKTSYKDFIYWYWKQRVLSLRNFRGKTSDDGLCKFTILAYDSWYDLFFYNQVKISFVEDKDFFDVTKNKEAFGIEYSPLFERIHKSIETKGWVDIENEYYSLLVLLYSHVEDNYLNHNKQLDYLRDLLIKYLSQINYDLLLKKDSTIEEHIFAELDPWREYSYADRNLYQTNTTYDILEKVMLLSFNYTKTPELYKNSDTVINYIHGRLDDPNSVIFGYGDELDDGYKKLRDKNDNECLKNMKSIKYLESDNYRKVLEFIESSPFQICIMGHSCGNSDRTLLNTLFEHRNCVSIKPYYYIKDDGTDNYLDLTMNISRNFTDMKLMRDRVVNKEYCEPLTNRKNN